MDRMESIDGSKMGPPTHQLETMAEDEQALVSWRAAPEARPPAVAGGRSRPPGVSAAGREAPPAP